MSDAQLTVLHAKPGPVSARFFIDTTTVKEAVASSEEDHKGLALYMRGKASPLQMIEKVVKVLQVLIGGKHRHRNLYSPSAELFKFSTKSYRLSPIDMVVGEADSLKRVTAVFQTLPVKQSECIVKTSGDVNEMERLIAQLRGGGEGSARSAAADAAVESTALESSSLAAAERTRIKVDEFLNRGWLTSAQIGRLLSKSTTNPGQYAADARARGQLLGAWDATRRTFVHPDFQFDELGHIDPRVEKLMAAFAEHPDLSPERDKGGWRRVFWLYSTRPELGDTSEMSEDGNNEALEGHPPVRGVSPVERFAADADSVIRLVRNDAERLNDEW